MNQGGNFECWDVISSCYGGRNVSVEHEIMETFSCDVLHISVAFVAGDDDGDAIGHRRALLGGQRADAAGASADVTLGFDYLIPQTDHLLEGASAVDAVHQQK